MSGGSRQHWVLIETGGNQAYIFDTNRLRHVVGASHLVHELGKKWVPKFAPHPGARVVLAISGKALLLVTDPAVGKAVISDVSKRALAEAPGLQVTGVVGPGFDPNLDWLPEDSDREESGDEAGEPPFTHVQALRCTYDLMEMAREDRPSPQLRDPLLPWFAVCRESGLPVAGREPLSVPVAERRPDDGLAAASVLAKSKVRYQARDRMRGLLIRMPGVVPENLDDLRNDGWVAVVHADGNGVGKVFTRFAEHALAAVRAGGDSAAGLSLEEHARRLREFTGELETATEAALEVAVRDAIARLQADRRAAEGDRRAAERVGSSQYASELDRGGHHDGSQDTGGGNALGQDARSDADSGRDVAGTILPVVVGGDDLTLVCHASLALPLVRAFATAFKELTATLPEIRAIIGGSLTVAAGIAYVKPHHPFSAAYLLAEELVASAKSVIRAGERPVSAVDLHVTFESTLAELPVLRSRLVTGGLARYGGPYVITELADQPVGPREIACLDRTRAVLGKLSSSLAHELREGLALGPEEYALRVGRAARSPDLPPKARSEIEFLQAVSVAEGGNGDSPTGQRNRFVRLLDALLLDAISQPPKAPAGDDGGSPATDRVEVPA